MFGIEAISTAHRAFVNIQIAESWAGRMQGYYRYDLWYIEIHNDKAQSKTALCICGKLMDLNV